MVIGLDRRLDGVQIHRAVGLMLNGLRLDRAQHCGTTCFMSVAMRILPGDELVAAATMAHQCQQIGLRARGHEQCRILAQHRCYAEFQLFDRRIIAEHVIAHLGLCHRLAHGRRWSGHGVGAKIKADRSHGRFQLCIPPA